MSGDPLPAERRLSEPPLPQPKIAFAGQQSVAEDRPIQPETKVFAEIPIIGDEYILDVIGVIEQQQRLWTKTNGHNVAVLAGTPSDKPKRVALVVGQVSPKKMALRSRRTNGSGQVRFSLGSGFARAYYTGRPKSTGNLKRQLAYRMLAGSTGIDSEREARPGHQQENHG